MLWELWSKFPQLSFSLNSRVSFLVYRSGLDSNAQQPLLALTTLDWSHEKVAKTLRANFEHFRRREFHHERNDRYPQHRGTRDSNTRGTGKRRGRPRNNGYAVAEQGDSADDSQKVDDYAAEDYDHL